MSSYLGLYNENNINTDNIDTPTINVDSISEYTENNGVNIENINITNNTLTFNNLYIDYAQIFFSNPFLILRHYPSTNSIVLSDTGININVWDAMSNPLTMININNSNTTNGVMIQGYQFTGTEISPIPLQSSNLGKSTNSFNNGYINNLICDTISEYTLNNGINIDSVNIKDGVVTGDLLGTATYISTNSTNSNSSFYCMLSNANYSQSSTSIYTSQTGYLAFNPLTSTLTNPNVDISSNLSVDTITAYTAGASGNITINALNLIPSGTAHIGTSLDRWISGNMINIYTNIIYESTANNGIFIDGVHLKDGLINDTSYSNGILHSDINGSITSSSIVNGDIHTSANITDTKLATISTSGKVLNSATTATSSNTASAIVSRDASGNFTAGNITATSTTQSANDNSTKLATTAYVDVPITAVIAGGITLKQSQGFSLTKAAGTYKLTAGDSNVLELSTGSAVSFTDLIYLDSSRYPAVRGVSPRLIVKGFLSTNNTSVGTVTYTLGLYPVSTTGGVGVIRHIGGTVVSGSDGASWVNPSTAVTTYATGSLFTFPSTGFYCFAYVQSAASAANSAILMNAMLELYYA